MKKLTTLIVIVMICAYGCGDSKHEINNHFFDIESIVKAAQSYLSKDPVTITNYTATRSKGGRHDYYSEGRYWWPDSRPYETDLEKEFNPEHNEFLFLSYLGLEEEEYLELWKKSSNTEDRTNSSLLIWQILNK